MRMCGTEARHLLAPWVHDHRRVVCLFGTSELNVAGSGILWSVDAEILTIRQIDDAGDICVDLHIPFGDVAIEYFEPGESPSSIRPTKPLEWFEGAIYLQEPELSQAGTAIELRWVVWIANPGVGRRSLAAGAS